MKRLFTVALFLLAFAGAAFAQDIAPINGFGKKAAVPYDFSSPNSTNKTSAASSFQLTYYKAERLGLTAIPQPFVGGYFNSSVPDTTTRIFQQLGTVYSRFFTEQDSASVPINRATNYRIDSVFFDVLLIKASPASRIDTVVYQLMPLDSFRVGSQVVGTYPSKTKAPLISDTVFIFQTGVIDASYVLKTIETCSFDGKEYNGKYMTNGQPVAAIVKFFGALNDTGLVPSVLREVPNQPGFVYFNTKFYSVGKRGDQNINLDRWSNAGQSGGNSFFYSFAHHSMTGFFTNDTSYICVDTTTSGVDLGNTLTFDNAYPNPAVAGSIVNLPFTLKMSGVVTAQVTNVNGQVVFNHETDYLLPGVYDFKVNTTGYTPGIYFVSVRTATGTATQKLVVY